MIINLKTRQEAISIVRSILNQGDSRYNDYYAEFLLASFLLHNSVIMEKREIPPITKPLISNLSCIEGPQEKAKYTASILLKKEGFQDSKISFEQWIQGGKADVLAVSNKKIIAVECFSCRVSKILDYLSEKNADTEVWVLTRGHLPWENVIEEKMEWFIFRKGKDFHLKLDKLKEIQDKEIKRSLDKLPL